MPLQRRNGRFQVFSRIRKSDQRRVWFAAKIVQGQPYIFLTNENWYPVMTEAVKAASGKVDEFQKQLNQ